MNDRGLSIQSQCRVITRGFARNLKNQKRNHSPVHSTNTKFESSEVGHNFLSKEYVHKKFDKFRKYSQESSTEMHLKNSIECLPSEGYWSYNKRCRLESDGSLISKESISTKNPFEPIIKTEKNVFENEFKNYKEYEKYPNFSSTLLLNKSISPVNIKTNPKLSSIVLSLPAHKLSEICRYNPNMARKFPPKERTFKELERRIKNTEACRISRRKRKLEDLARDQLIEGKTKKHFGNLRNIMYNLFYIHMTQRSVLEVMQQFDEASAPSSECIE